MTAPSITAIWLHVSRASSRTRAPRRIVACAPGTASTSASRPSAAPVKYATPRSSETSVTRWPVESRV